MHCIDIGHPPKTKLRNNLKSTYKSDLPRKRCQQVAGVTPEGLISNFVDNEVNQAALNASNSLINCNFGIERRRSAANREI